MNLHEWLDGAAELHRSREAADELHWPEAIDLAALAKCEPQPPQHIIPGWLPAGEVTLLAGHGGAGKSAIALYIAACIALGVPCYGLATERRRVLYLSHEDRPDVIHWRMSSISRYLRVPMPQIAEYLRVLDASGVTAELVTDTREGAVVTGAHAWLAEQARGYPVLVIDGASDSYGASEIIRRDVRRYVRALRRLVPADGAVLLLAHIDKAAARRKEDGEHYSGSTAWNNSVRARWSLRADGEGLALALEKANHAQAGAEIRLRWDAEAHLYVADEAPTDGGMVSSIRDRTEREGILAAIRACGGPVPAATQGPRTTWHVLVARPELPDSMRSAPDGRRRFWRALEELRAIGAVRECSIRRGDRHYIAGLELSTEERG
jgi:hypothetical protein